MDGQLFRTIVNRPETVSSLVSALPLSLGERARSGFVFPIFTLFTEIFSKKAKPCGPAGIGIKYKSDAVPRCDLAKNVLFDCFPSLGCLPAGNWAERTCWGLW